MRILFVILFMSTVCYSQSKKELEVKVAELNNSIAELQNQNKSLNAKIQNIETQKKELNNNVNDFRTKVQTFRAEKDEMVKRPMWGYILR